MTLHRIDAFDTANPEKLADQLQRLEDNVSRETESREPLLTWSDWVATFPARASYDSVLRCDTEAATASVGVSLPSISSNTVGHRVGILRNGTQNIDLSPVESTALIGGSPTAVLAGNGLYFYIHDGATWYRA